MLRLSYNLSNVTVTAQRGVRQTKYPNKATVDLSEEKQLVERAKTNAESFGIIYDYYFPKIYAFVAAKTSNRDDAEDLTGEIFMKALENLHHFEWRGIPFGAWLFRIARNTINDYYRDSAKNRTGDLEKIADLKQDEANNSPDRQAGQNELAAKVREVLSTLPERELNVIQLKFFSGMSNREIVDITGLSESHIAVIIYRTLRKIKPDLKKFA